MSEDKSVILYLRVSCEDFKLSEAIESNSITSQRQLLQQYLQKNQELGTSKIIEMIDDGFSGTNFQRPQFEKMIELSMKGKVKCIIVKDFSRFGRNYIELGHYLECVFPMQGIRFISVNDGFDSEQVRGTTGGLEVSFRNFIYDMYCKDLSKKVKSAIAVRQRQGEFLSPYAFYGYKKSEENKHSLVVDEEAAKVVREIFQMAADQYSTYRIARSLNEKGILTPAEYKKKMGLNRYCNISSCWTQDKVTRIVRDERYLGKLIFNKRVRSETGSKKTVKVSRENWITVSGTHPAIIPKELYDQANGTLKVIHEKKKVQSEGKRGIYFCGSCGKKLRTSKNKAPYLECPMARYVDKRQCGEIKIEKEGLETVLLQVIGCFNQILKNHKIQDKTIKRLQLEIKGFENKKIELYEYYKQKNISQHSYFSQKKVLTEQIESSKNQIQHLAKENQVEAKNISDFIASVVVHEPYRITIEWRNQRWQQGFD
ncbi:recombinase family protein [Anaeromicropila populeti]|uniref:recombinase family protein n=1 Tax=Anaeromicropila populeti TaxID=37658 RepID=UPI0015A54489|nr:recombinase family protein [Anaeromicropila populeti]